MQAVFEYLSDSLHRELDFRQEAANIERMREVLEPYARLRVPGVHEDLSTSRLLVMQDVQGRPISIAPRGTPAPKPPDSCSSATTSRSWSTGSSTPTRTRGT